MNDYRSYFNRIQAPDSLHRKLLSGERPEKRPAPLWVKYGGMAACFALICLAGFGVWRMSTPLVGGDIYADSIIPGEKDTFGPGETPPAVAATPTTPPVSAGDEYELSPTERPMDPHVTLVNFEGGTELAANIAMPKGAFKKQLTREEMIGLLGGEDDAPWYLMWAGYDVGAEAIYDGAGGLWRITLSGREDGVNTFHMVLRPGALPEDCVVQNEAPTEINGVPVHGSKGQYGITGDAMGESRTLAFMAGEIGVTFTASNRSGENAEFLASLAANCYAGTPETETLFSLSLTGLDPYQGEIPQWRSENLTLDEARAEEGFGQYVPRAIPDGFAFENAHRELGQNRDWLHLFWAGYYTDLAVTIHREVLYDGSNGGGHAIPIAELTDERLAAQFQYVDADAGDRPGHRANFAVDYGDGFVVEYHLKGVTPEEMAQMIK